MGTPKALLPFDDEPLIAHIVRTLQPLVDEVVVVAAPGQDLPSMPVTLVRDDVAFQGPVGGIYYGLTASSGEVSFITSCDSAFLNVTLISHLLSLITCYDVVVPHWEGRLQPLHAVYRRSVLPMLGAQLARGDLRPVHLFDRVRTRRVDEDEIRRFDPDGASFFNMNTPDEYAEAQRRWRSRAADGDSPAAAPVHCTVELFGVARLVGKSGQVTLTLPHGATVEEMLAALADTLPALVGRVIGPDGRSLVDGFACNVNGLQFVHTPTAPVNPGDTILILSADAGG